jgi:hypothetical protein
VSTKSGQHRRLVDNARAIFKNRTLKDSIADPQLPDVSGNVNVTPPSDCGPPSDLAAGLLVQALSSG